MNGLFQLDISGNVWTLDLKNGNASASNSSSSSKPDIFINMDDATFLSLSDGSLSGQQAFMKGKLKIKGNMMLATKLDVILKLVPKSSPKPTLSISVDGFESSHVFSSLKAGADALTETEKKATLQKVKAIFQFDVKNGDKVESWTLDLKKECHVLKGVGSEKPDIVLSVADKDMVDLASGKLAGQKAFMQGKIKIKGNMMLATKLDAAMKALVPKSRL